MRLEPVYLVAPRQTPPSIPSRRAFLLAGGAFAIGSALGGACGYSLGASAGGGKGAEGDSGESTGDATLDELRRLAVEAPVSELVQQALFFCYQRDTAYSRDAVLWRGIERLAKRIIEDPSTIDRGVLLVVIATIERGSPPDELKLTDLLPDLRKIRSSRR